MPRMADILATTGPEPDLRPARQRILDSVLDPNVVDRGSILPIGRKADGGMTMAVPEIGLDIARSLMLPGDVVKGEPYTMKDALLFTADIAGMGGFGSAGLGKLATGKAPGKVLGAHVYQGGPHKYGPEGAAQSLKHINKGEGAQAYGWGRYDAGNPHVARQYQAGVKNDGVIADINKELTRLSKIIDKDTGGQYGNFKSDAGREASRQYDALMAKRSAVVNDPGHLYKHDLPDEDIARYLDWDKPLSEQPESVRVALEAMPEFQRLSKSSGELSVEDLAVLGIQSDKPIGYTPTGEELYTSLARSMGVGKEGVSEALRKAGIPGTKYLDEGSRNLGRHATINGKPIKEFFTNDYDLDTLLQKVEQGYDIPHVRQVAAERSPELAAKFDALDIKVTDPTHNYVTWDEDVLKRMKLLERNGETFDTLPMDTASRMARAREQGFDVERSWYHGTDQEFDKFDNGWQGTNTNSGEEGFFFTDKVKYAQDFAKGRDARVIDARLRMTNPLVVKWTDDVKPTINGKPVDFTNNQDAIKFAQKNGHDGVVFEEFSFSDDGATAIIFDPANIRSKHAKFDPANKGKADLLGANTGPGAALTALLDRVREGKRKAQERANRPAPDKWNDPA